MYPKSESPDTIRKWSISVGLKWFVMPVASLSGHVYHKPYLWKDHAEEVPLESAIDKSVLKQARAAAVHSHDSHP